MKKLNYFIIFILLLPLTLLVNAQEKRLEDWRPKDKMPVTSDELVKDHLEKMQLEFFDGNNVRLQHTSKLLPDYYARDTYLMQVWDGTAWKDSIRGDYTYNPQGWLTELLYEVWSSVWINYSHFTYTYTGYGYVATEIAQNWSGSSWVNYSRTTNTYNASNKKTQTTYEYWNGASWGNSEQFLYEYFPNGNLQKQVSQYWSGGMWVNSGQQLYEYDSNNLITMILNQYWSGGVWVNNAKLNYSYNSNGDYLTIVMYTWSGGWQNYQQALFTYDGNGWLTNTIYQSWDSLTGWINYQKDSYTYDGNGNQTEHLRQNWSGSQWTNYSRKTNVYNSGGNCIEYTFEMWNYGTGWENNSHFRCEYDSHGNVLNEEYQYWNGTEWINNVRYVYTWLFFVSDVENDGPVKEYSLANNYPNPFNPTTTISFSIPSSEFVTLKVVDVLGNEIETLVNEEKPSGNYEVKWYALGLPSGVYFYRLQARSFIETKKMLLIK